MTTQMTPRGQETTVDTAFGSVSDRRVSYYYKKGWFNSGSQEDLPLRHITSVRLETTRHVLWGGVLALCGLGAMAAGAGGILVGLIFMGVAGLLFWGSPRVVVNTAGGDLRPATGFPWTKQEAETFVSALRAQLFRD